MDLCDYKQIQALLSESGFHFSKAKGQNFLIDSSVPERIAEAACLDSGTGVVEIGPGVGCLTEQLARRAGRVASFEVDMLLRPVLARTMAPYDNVEVEFADVMHVDLRRAAEEKLAGLRPVLCANLPYSITTPLLTKVFEAKCFETITVMVQKEVADRICAKPGQKDYGAFTLLAQWYTEPELLFTVGPEFFLPRPKVTSAVVRMRVRTEPPVEADEKTLFRVIRAAFNQRRKTLVNALDSVYGREKTRAALAACGFPETIRGEALTLAEFAALTKELMRYSGEG